MAESPYEVPGLRRRPKGGPFKPPERSDDEERRCDLRSPGQRQRPMQQADRGEYALHFLVADQIVLQRQAGELAVGKKALPRRRAKRGERRGRERRHGRRGGDQRRPPTGENERERDDQSQVRLERHGAKKNAAKRGLAVHRQETAADERRA